MGYGYGPAVSCAMLTGPLNADSWSHVVMQYTPCEKMRLPCGFLLLSFQMCVYPDLCGSSNPEKSRFKLKHIILSPLNFWVILGGVRKVKVVPELN
jgi:hypothetical protein